MSEYFDKVKNYLAELDLSITDENDAEELVVVENENDGIKNLIIDCEDPILVIEQLIMEVPDGADGNFYLRLLQMNRTLVHGAFVVDEGGKYVLFRDTLQLANLDHNELEASISALSLAMAEHSGELLGFTQAAA